MAKHYIYLHLMNLLFTIITVYMVLSESKIGKIVEYAVIGCIVIIVSNLLITKNWIFDKKDN